MSSGDGSFAKIVSTAAPWVQPRCQIRAVAFLTARGACAKGPPRPDRNPGPTVAMCAGTLVPAAQLQLNVQSCSRDKYRAASAIIARIVNVLEIKRCEDSAVQRDGKVVVGLHNLLGAIGQPTVT